MIDNAKVIYSLLDPSIAEDTSTDTQSSNSDNSDVNNLANLTDKSKLAYLEQDYFVLDGTHIFSDGTRDVGWESANLSNASNVINEWLNFAFTTTHDSYGIIVNFQQDSFSEDFNIIYYASSAVLYTTTVTGNTLYNYRDTSNVLGWDEIKIEISKTSKPQQRARIQSVVFGIKEIFTGDELIKITASNSTDLTASNVDAGEVEFQFYNDGTFDIQSVKDLPDSVQQGMSIEVSFGRGGTYVDFGKYSSVDIKTDDLGKLVTVGGYDDFYKIGKTYYEKGTIPTSSVTLTSLATAVASDAGIDITIDGSLDTIYTDGYISYVPHREALRLIAEAGNCILYVDANGVNHIAPHAGGTSVEITDDNILDNSFIVSNTEKISGVVVNRYTFTLSTTASGLAEIQGIALLGVPQTIWVDYATFPANVDVSDIAASANIVIDTINTICYSDRAKIVFTGTVSEVGWITIIGYAYATASVSVSDGNFSGTVKQISNTLITSSTVADNVLTYQMSRTENVYKYTADVYLNSDIPLGNEAKLNGNDIYITKITRSINTDTATETLEGYDA